LSIMRQNVFIGNIRYKRVFVASLAITSWRVTLKSGVDRSASFFSRCGSSVLIAYDARKHFFFFMFKQILFFHNSINSESFHYLMNYFLYATEKYLSSFVRKLQIPRFVFSSFFNIWHCATLIFKFAALCFAIVTLFFSVMFWN